MIDDPTEGEALGDFLTVATVGQCTVPGCRRGRATGDVCAEHVAILYNVLCATRTGIEVRTPTGPPCVACGGEATKQVTHKPQLIPFVRKAVGKGPLAGYWSVWCTGCYTQHLTLGLDVWATSFWVKPKLTKPRDPKLTITGSRYRYTTTVLAGPNDTFTVSGSWHV